MICLYIKDFALCETIRSKSPIQNGPKQKKKHSSDFELQFAEKQYIFSENKINLDYPRVDCNYYVCSDSIPKVQELQEFHCGKIGDQQQEEQKQQAPPQQQRDNDDDYDTEKDNDDNTNNKSLEKTSKSILSILFARDTTVKEISLPAPKPIQHICHAEKHVAVNNILASRTCGPRTKKKKTPEMDPWFFKSWNQPKLHALL